MRLMLCLMIFSSLGIGLVAESENTAKAKVFTLADGVLFQMGRIEGSRIIHPRMGAEKLTFNYIQSLPGDEFPQHVHDYSDDTFLVLEGQVDVRQGESRRHLGIGYAAFVPSGQIHGTITTGSRRATLISFQAPPDLRLYTGERDSSKPGAKPPVGVITLGALKLLEFQNQNGFFLHPGLNSEKVAVAYRTLKPNARFLADFPSEGEGILFIWKGAVSVTGTKESYFLEDKNLFFASEGGSFEVFNGSENESIVIQIQSPPGSAK